MSPTNRTSLLIAIAAVAAAALLGPAGGVTPGEVVAEASGAAAELGAELLDPAANPWEQVAGWAHQAAENARCLLAMMGVPVCL